MFLEGNDSGPKNRRIRIFALFTFKPFANGSGLLINDINLQKKRN